MNILSRHRYRDYLAQHKKRIVLTVLCALITVSINLTLPYILRLAIDRLTEGTMTLRALGSMVLLYLGLALAVAWFARQLRRLPLLAGHGLEYCVRRDLFAHLTRLDPEFFRTHRTGDLMTRATSDLNVVRDATGQGLLQGIRTVIALVMAAGVMIIVHAQLAMLLLCIYVPMVLFFFAVLRILRHRQKALQEKLSELSSFAQESFSGIRCIKGFALESRWNWLFASESEQLAGKEMRLQSLRQLLWPLMALWFSAATLMLMYTGGSDVIRGTLSVGVLVQFSQYLLYLQWPLLSLSWMMSLVQRGRVSWLRITELFDSVPQVADTAITDQAIRSLDGSLALSNVSLKADGVSLLEDIELEIAAGQTVGITGPTGCGKTLLVSLFARLAEPTSGTVLAGGVDVRQIPLAVLREQIGFAQQEPVLFSRTLEHNIAFGLEVLDEATVSWAAAVARLHADIESFPGRYQTVVGERGVTLSGGQRQRTAISRALARHPRILILDDVLSAVDTQTEAEIMRNLQPVMAGCTCLFVSHRASTLQYTDTIVVIEHGRITQRGTHAELSQSPGYYAELVQRQQLQARLEGAL